jgi:UDP-glucose 4-epimerase
MDLRGKRIIVSGGAGFIGRSLVGRLLAEGSRVTVVSRDEEKHSRLRRQFPDVETFICDVRDLELLRKLTRGHDVAIWAASLKQIDTCSKNPQMAKEIILDGALNARTVSDELLEAAVFISTDKSRAPTTLYGYLKGAAGEAFILDAGRCRVTTAIYGNVWNSTGSAVPRIWEHIVESREMTLYSEQMTRFMIDAEDAIDLLVRSLDHSGCYTLPRLRSFRVQDLFELYRDEFGLRYRIGKPRVSEKIHEVMATAEEVPRLRWSEKDALYRMSPTDTFDAISAGSAGSSEPRIAFEMGEYSSRDHVISKAELKALLAKNDFFRPGAPLTASRA